jgi:hypothetical protein
MVGVGLWFMRGRMVVFRGAETKEKTKMDEYYEELSKDSYRSETIMKGKVEDKDRVSFIFVGEMVDGLVLEEWGGLTGKIIIEGDELNREVRVSINNSQVYLGIFNNNDFKGGSEWSYQDVEKVAELVSPGDKVQVRITHDYNEGAELNDYFFEKDKMLDELLKDIVNEEWDYELPENFGINIVSLGVVL